MFPSRVPMGSATPSPEPLVYFSFIHSSIHLFIYVCRSPQKGALLHTREGGSFFGVHGPELGADSSFPSTGGFLKMCGTMPSFSCIFSQRDAQTRGHLQPYIGIKVKTIPLQAWTSLEGSRRLRLPDFKTFGT
jgi:hypothetical protein